MGVLREQEKQGGVEKRGEEKRGEELEPSALWIRMEALVTMPSRGGKELLCFTPTF